MILKYDICKLKVFKDKILLCKFFSDTRILRRSYIHVYACLVYMHAICIYTFFFFLETKTERLAVVFVQKSWVRIPHRPEFLVNWQCSNSSTALGYQSETLSLVDQNCDQCRKYEINLKRKQIYKILIDHVLQMLMRTLKCTEQRHNYVQTRQIAISLFCS